jgi:hypothetical protein
MSLKSCNIIYGYVDKCLDKYQDSPNVYVLLIEPRVDIIDRLKKPYPKNIILVSKMLLEKNLLTESILYFNKEQERYFTKNDVLFVDGTSYFNVKKYNVFTTSINNLIIQYNIQNIISISININIQNCNEILDSIIPFNHIISNIIINDTVNLFSENCKILQNFYKKDDLTFTHKNLNIKLPNIGMFINGNKKITQCNKKISLLIQQYKMNLIITRKKNSFIIPYPESMTICNVCDTYSKIYHENIIQNLECIFCKNETNQQSETNELITNQQSETNELITNQQSETNELITNQQSETNELITNVKKLTDISELDIIIKFNTKYFDNNSTLQIMYPLKDNILYVNKVFDIIYGTKNCIYMLYQILKSKYFSDFLEVKKVAKPKLFTIFSKIYFFEYISKIFVIKEF